jgi:hypothetical protein
MFALPSEGGRVREAPLPARVLLRHALDREPGSAGNLLECLFDSRPVRQHGRALSSAYVVQVDVHRETGKIEHEQIERRAAFERHPRSEKGMRADRFEQADKDEDLLVGLQLESAVSRRSLTLVS